MIMDGLEAVSLPRHQNIDYVAILIGRSPQTMPSAPDGNEQFVDEQDAARLPLLSSWRSSIAGAKLAAPTSNRLKGDDDTTLCKQVFFGRNTGVGPPRSDRRRNLLPGFSWP